MTTQQRPTSPVTRRGETLPGETIAAIGDVHGSYRLLQKMLKGLNARLDAARAEGRRVTLVVLGDYIDKTDGTPQTLDLLRETIDAGARIADDMVLIRGNHEQMLLDVLDGAQPKSWWRSGGRDTARSYGVAVPDGWRGKLSMARVGARLTTAIPQAHQRLLRGTELSYENGGYLFVHAGVRPGVPLAQQSPLDLLTIREPFLSDPNPNERCVVHGHTPSEKIQLRQQRIGLDLGGFATGRLGAVVLEDARVEPFVVSY